MPKSSYTQNPDGSVTQVIAPDNTTVILTQDQILASITDSNNWIALYQANIATLMPILTQAQAVTASLQAAQSLNANPQSAQITP